jgi:hypothetical protein
MLSPKSAVMIEPEIGSPLRRVQCNLLRLRVPGVRRHANRRLTMTLGQRLREGLTNQIVGNSVGDYTGKLGEVSTSTGQGTDWTQALKYLVSSTKNNAQLGR